MDTEYHATRSGSIVRQLGWGPQRWSDEARAQSALLEDQKDVVLWPLGGGRYEYWRFTGQQQDALAALKRVRWYGWPEPRWRGFVRSWWPRLVGALAGLVVGLSILIYSFGWPA